MIKVIFICGLIILFIWPIFIISSECSRKEEVEYDSKSI